MNILIICKMDERDSNLCKAIAKRGHTVYFSFAAENKSLAEELISIPEVNGQLYGTLIDLNRKETINEIVEVFSFRKVLLDCFITSIHTCYMKPLEDLTHKETMKMISDNINSLYYAVKKALPLLIENKAFYVNIVDSCAYSAVKDMTAYAMTEAASIGFIKSLAKEYSRHGVRAVNIVTDLVSGKYIQSQLGNKELKELEKKRLSKRFAEVSEVCEQIADIISVSTKITGQSIFLDNLATDYMYC